MFFVESYSCRDIFTRTYHRCPRNFHEACLLPFEMMNLFPIYPIVDNKEEENIASAEKIMLKNPHVSTRYH